MLLGQKRRDTTVTTRRRRRAKRPANVIAAVVGVCAIALGVWALVKTGINTDHIFTPTKDVLGLPHTPTLALGEIGFGIVLLAAAALGKFGTFVIALAGAASFAFGVIVLTDSWSGRVHRWTAADHDSGWVFIAVGAVLVLAAVLPLLVSRRRVQPQEAPAMQPQEAPAMEHEPVPAEPDPAKASTVTNESAQPAPTGAVRPTETTTDARDTDNINTHATS
jgi:hypothetical protein